MLCVSLAAPFCFGQVTPRPTGDIAIDVLTAQGPLRLVSADDVNALRVTARPRDVEVARFAGPVRPPQLFTLTNEVVVSGREADVLAVAGAGAVAPIPGLTEFWTVTYASVGAAVDGAAALRDAGFGDAVVLLEEQMSERGADPGDMTDPLFMDQWHMENTIDPLFDCNASDAWALGFSGFGIVAGVVESGGGYQTIHPDLAGNHNAAASNTTFTNSAHATRVAGIMGAVGYNNEGVRGLAYESQISSLYIGTTSATRAAALAHMNDVHDVKNNSWGPTDNGNIFHLAAAERQALEDAALLGRGGLGMIMCWAAGNGGTEDRMDYDGFANSRYTIACGWIGDGDTRSDLLATFGNETGSAMLVVAHSDGNTRAITTTNRGVNPYTATFGGSSAACPLLTGTVALMLQANPMLTWRDVQHILVETARKNDPMRASWETNAAGHDISYDYGFGALETHDAVAAAMTWSPAAPAMTAGETDVVGMTIPANDPAGVVRTISVSDDLLVEHVEVTLNIAHSYRGDLEIVLTSPSGTESVLALMRDDSGDDYTDFTFMTARCWGESSVGDWTLRISDLFEADTGTWTDWTLAVHGTPVVTECPGDVNGDLSVDFADLNELLDHWGETVEPGTLGDVDGSGMVDFADLNLLLDEWGTVCE